MSKTHFDVLILGAGLSGIGAACHLTRKMPEKTYAILENRDAIGGTWDLFRYPGIRSDSDMTTFGYSFRPWNSPKMLADGNSIKYYVTEAANEHNVVPHIRFKRKVTRAEWSSEQAVWTVYAHNHAKGVDEVYTAQYLISATGYYNHDKGFAPQFPGADQFKGQIVHPQFWPSELDYEGKKVVVIGSGATAVTLVPTMAQRGATKVTMLQRSPTYVISVPGFDPLWKILSAFLPAALVYLLLRIKNVLLGRLLFRGSARWPNRVRSFLLGGVKKQLGDKVDMKHFTPRYRPWEQRLCAVPDGDLFKVIRNGKAAVVTDTIKRFDATGIQLDSGEHLDADIIVTATGLELQAFGGVDVNIDGQPLVIKDRLVYKGMLLEDVPNFLHVSGYTNASWTLKADISIAHFLRIIRHMDATGRNMVTARAKGTNRKSEHAIAHFSSGYVQRGAHTYPLQGTEKPWVVLDDYLGDAITLKFSRIDHPALEFRTVDQPLSLAA